MSDSMVRSLKINIVLITLVVCSWAPDAMARLQQRRRTIHPGAFVLISTEKGAAAELVAGQDGNVWWWGEGTVGYIDSAGQSQWLRDVSFVGRLTATPDGVCGGATDAGWSIIRCVTREASVTDMRIRPSAGLASLSLAGGTLWFAETTVDAIGFVGGDHLAHEIPLSPLFSTPSAAVTDSHGRLLFAVRQGVMQFNDAAELILQDASGLFRDRPYSSFNDMITSPDGAFWLVIDPLTFSDGTRVAGSLVRLEGDGTFREVLTLEASHVALHIAADLDGSAWYVDHDLSGSEPDALIRLRSNGTYDQYAVPFGRQAGIGGIAVDRSGSVWVGLYPGVGKLLR